MSTELRRLTENYVPAFLAFLNNPTEQRRHVAYELGRAALSHGVTLLDMISTHHVALSSLMAGLDPDDQARIHENAASFLSEALAPYEMASRGYLDRMREDSQHRTDQH